MHRKAQNGGMDLIVDTQTWITLAGILVATLVLWFTARRNERETRAELRAEIVVVETRLETKISDLKTGLDTKITDLKTGLETKITDLKTGVETKITDTTTGLEARIVGVEQRLDRIEHAVSKLDDRVYGLATHLAPALGRDPAA